MGKAQYAQKFREEWLNDKLFKDWLVKIEIHLKVGVDSASVK